jgi:hypothetical protein
MKFIVTNIDQTTQKLMDKQGQMIFLEPGQSILMTNPPNSPNFKVEPLEKEAEEIHTEETESSKRAEEKQLNKKKEVKNARRLE